MDDTIEEFVKSIQQLPELTFGDVLETFPSVQTLPDSSTANTIFLQLAEQITAFKTCKLHQNQRTTLETHQLTSKTEMSSCRRQLETKHSELKMAQQSLNSAYGQAVQVQNAITPPSQTTARYNPTDCFLQNQHVNQMLEQAKMKLDALYLLDTKLTIYHLAKAIDLSQSALKTLDVFVNPYQDHLPHILSQYIENKKQLTQQLDMLNTHYPDLTQFLTKDTLEKEMELLNTGLNACQMEKQRHQSELKNLGLDSNKTSVLDNQFHLAPDKEAFVRDETDEGITLGQCIITAKTWIVWAMGSYANSSTEQDVKQKESQRLQSYLKTRLAEWKSEQQILDYQQKITQCRTFLNDLPSNDSNSSSSNPSHVFEKLTPLLGVQKSNTSLLEYIQLTKEKIHSLEKDVERHQTIITQLEHLSKDILDIRHQRQTAKITLPSAELFPSPDDAERLNTQREQRNEEKKILTRLITCCQTFSDHYRHHQQLHHQQTDIQNQLKEAQESFKRITQKLQKLASLEELVSKEKGLQQHIVTLAKTLKLPDTKQATDEPVDLSPNASEEIAAPLTVDQGLPKAVQNCLITLQKHVTHLKKDGFENEAACLEEAVERFRQLANPTENSSKEAPPAYDFYKTESRFESLHRHRGVLKLLEVLAEFCMAVYAALFQKTQSNYRDCFFFKPTRTSQYLAETERCLLKARQSY